MKNMSIFGENSIINNEYFLMNKDEVLLYFYLESTIIEDTVEEIKRYSSSLPLGYVNIRDWLESRKAPKHRKYIKKLLQQCGIVTLKDFVNVSYCLSLNDTFWVKPKSKDLKWEDINLYDNSFNEIISRIAFDGGMYGLEFSSTSPELGTDGSFAKCWIRENGIIKLLKRGSSDYVNAGLEPYSEYYTSQISKLICKHSVQYNLRKHHNSLASECDLFTSKKIGYVPYYKINPDKYANPSELLEYYKSIGSEDDFRRMIVFDGIIMNQDRHLGNHGILFDCDTLEVIGMAPVFDNNISMLCYVMKDDFEDLDGYLKDKGPKIGNDFITMAKWALTSSIRKDLINMKGFKFKRHYKFNLPEWRLNILEKKINENIIEILK